MGAITGTSAKKIMMVAVAAAATGLAAACGGTSTPSPSGPSGSATASASATGTAGLAQLKAVATGPEAKKLQADLATFINDASSQNLTAAEADARQVAADITAWADAMRAVTVPAAYQAAKAAILKGLALMSTGVTEVADGLHNKDMTQINKGNADVQQAVKIINQASAMVP